jgi:hypothetical protein
VYRFFGYSWPGENRDKTQYIILFSGLQVWIASEQDRRICMAHHAIFISVSIRCSALFKISSYFVYRRGTGRNVFQIIMLLGQTLLEDIPVKNKFHLLEGASSIQKLL